MSCRVLQLSDVSKGYAGGIKALCNVNLEIPRGMFGLLGPNGAGKSTLMRTIATLQAPDAGAITFGGIDVLREKTALRKVLGYLPQEFGAIRAPPHKRMLRHLAALKGLHGPQQERAVEQLLVRTNLWEVRKRSVDSFSGGMKQRFGIAQALLGNPQLLIVDEPTAGLDPAERRASRICWPRVSEEIVVILSTHIVDDVAELCPRLAIMGQGRILLAGRAASADRRAARQVVGRAGRSRRSGAAAQAVRRAVVPAQERADRSASDGRGTTDGHGRGNAGSRGRLLRHPASTRTDGEPGIGPSVRDFLDVLRFELRLQCRSPMFAGLLLLFFLIHLLTMSRVGINIGDNELIKHNSVYQIFLTELVLSVFGMLPAIIFVVNAATRDHALATAELFYTTPVGRLAFLLGRFSGGTLCALGVGLAGILGTLTGTFMPWLEADRVADFSWQPYAVCFTALVVPNLLVFCAFSFCVAALSRAAMLELCNRAGIRGAGARDQYSGHGRCAGMAVHARPVWSIGGRAERAILDRGADEYLAAGGSAARQPSAMDGTGGAGVRTDLLALSARADTGEHSPLKNPPWQATTRPCNQGATVAQLLQGARHAGSAGFAVAHGPARGAAEPAVLGRGAAHGHQHRQ